ncbi:MAG: hypothetical protein RIB60_10600 [Phycisphaerales bacterium]
MTHATSHARMWGVSFAIAAGLLVGCQEQGAEPESADPAAEVTEQTPPSDAPASAGTDAPTGDAEAAGEAVEEIRQGADNELQQPASEPSSSGLASLPGFTPSSPAREADTRFTPALPVTANTPDDAPILITITAVDVTDASPEALMPLEGFLAADGTNALDDEEVEGLFELLGTLVDQGEIAMLSNARVLVKGGQAATIEIENVLTLSIPGVDASRDRLEAAFTPALTAPVGEGPDAERFVRLAMDVKMSREESPWQVVVNDLGLDVGPSTRVSATPVVRSGETVYAVRRLVSESANREVLLLVRPQVMPQELNK